MRKSVRGVHTVLNRLGRTVVRLRLAQNSGGGFSFRSRPFPGGTVVAAESVRYRPVLRSLEALINVLPKAVALRRGAYGRNTRAGIDLLLGDRPAEQRERILSGVIRHRLINRAIFRFHSALPALAKRFAMSVPIVGSYRALVPDASVPLIIASGHFGPLFFATAVLERLLRGRRVIVVLREGALYFREVVPLLHSLGFAYVTQSRDSGRALVRALREDSRTVLIFAFDTPVRSQRSVPFLNATIATSSVIAQLADLSGATILTSFWLWRNSRPCIVLDHALAIEPNVNSLERRKRVMDALYVVLEAYVRTSPEQWSGWDHLHTVSPRATRA